MSNPPPDLDAIFAAALERHGKGDVVAAEASYRQLLASVPGHAELNYLLGMALLAQGRGPDALEPLDQALEKAPDDARILSALGAARRAAGDVPGARQAFEAALRLAPDDAETRNNFGNLLLNTGEPAAAVQEFTRALLSTPTVPAIARNLALSLRATGRMADALKAADQAFGLNQADLVSARLLAELLLATGKPDRALPLLDQLLVTAPQDADLHHNRGVALVALNRQGEALAAYDTALKLAPSAIGYSARAVALKELGRLPDAVADARKALALDPNLADAAINLGNALLPLADHDGAIAAYDQALALRPDMLPSWGTYRLYALSYHAGRDAAAIFDEFKAWGDALAPLSTRGRIPYTNDRDPNRRLKIGYVSPDFRGHTSYRYFLPLFANHDPTNVELIAYSNVGSPDPWTDRFRTLFPTWRDIRALDDAQAAEMIRADGIDVLIDTTNHMADHRLGIFARAPAPVQATWLGTIWTSGLAVMDATIQDPYMAPPGAQAVFTERVERLPSTLFCSAGPGIDLAPTTLPALTNGFITFGYFGRSERLNPGLFRVWAQILNTLPGSRLKLDFRCFGDPATKDHFIAQLVAVGIDPARLDLGYSTNLWDGLAGIDMMLDSFPHSGGTMLFDAIWAGIPFVSLADRPPTGRIGSTILENLGLPDLIAPDSARYVELALALARNTDRLNHLRQTLQARIKASPIMDGKAFAQGFERVLRRLWRDWCRRGAP